MLPAHQRFGSDDRSCSHADLRLVIDNQLVTLQRFAKLVLNGQPVESRLVQLRTVEHELVAAPLLGSGHRAVRVHHQLFDGHPIVGRNAHAHAHGQGDLVPGNINQRVISSRSRSARMVASRVGALRSDMKATNVSLPMRVTVSTFRRDAVKRKAASFKTLSPAA